MARDFISIASGAHCQYCIRLRPTHSSMAWVHPIKTAEKLQTYECGEVVEGSAI